MKSVLEKDDIKVLLGKEQEEGIYSEEDIGEEKVIVIGWDKYFCKAEKFHDRQIIMCEQISLFVGKKDILLTGDFHGISETDVVFFTIKHLSVLIDYCKEENIDFIDCSFGGIEDLLDNARFLPTVSDGEIQKIKDYIYSCLANTGR